MADLQYKIIVGLEIHVQLRTNTKIFCGCALEFGAEPNSRVCPVCLGMPGSLPVMNKQAFEHSVLAGLALNRVIPKNSNSFNNIDFMGNVLFIPVFLLNIGTLIDLKIIHFPLDFLYKK